MKKLTPLNELIDHCREEEIRIDQAKRDGKLIPDLGVIIDLYRINRETLTYVRQNLGLC